MGRGKFKGKPTGRHSVSTPEEIGNDAPARPMVPFIAAGTSGRPRTFMKPTAFSNSYSYCPKEVHYFGVVFVSNDMQLKKRIDLFYGRSVEDGFGEGNVLLASSKWRHHNPYKLVP
uniref:Uncharacterized protein n=2 Tax=Zea mays TaxID=4577 RepID=B6SM30_MAIZE|nr:hypothetical protein [Zea mays]|eukprot:NP_001142685.1 uncharacterized protein LOC100274982 [Zea mays]